jgi:hypothetical protein
MKRLAVGAAAVLVALSCPTLADPVPDFDYQGKVLVNDLPYNGVGYFKLALRQAATTSNIWATGSTPAGDPGGYVACTVANGVFSIVLGAASNAIPTAAFASGSNLYLHVWFSSTTNGFVELTPAQRFLSTAYAMNAHLLDGLHAADLVAQATNAVTLAGDVVGPVGNVQIQPNAVGSPEIAPDSVAAADIAPNAVGTSEIADGTVASIDIADNTIMDVDVNAAAAIRGSKIQSGSLTNAGALQLATGSTGAQAVATGHPFLNAFGRVNTLAATAPNSLLTVLGAGSVYVSNLPPSTLLIGSPPAAGVGALSNLDHVVWVGTNGTAAGPGTIERPYDTPQNGYNAAAARYPNAPATLVIAGGSYAGGLDLNAGNIHVQGIARPELNELRAATPLAPFMKGKVRVDGLVITGQMVKILFLNVTGVKFRNVKMLEGMWLVGHDIELEDCYIAQRTAPQFGALRIGDGASAVTTVSVHNCAVEIADAQLPALKVEPNIQSLEVLWCEIVNRGGGPAIVDGEPGPISPVHLYAHNWIKGPPPVGPATALQDAQVLQGPTLGFYHNTVLGNVGFANGGTPHAQYYANNLVHGLINWPGGGVVGWLQAGAGTGADVANNTEFQLEYPALPDAWND